MTEDELIAQQRKMFSDIIEKDIPLQRAVRSTLQKQVSRIFEQGKNSSGGNIGQYDTSRSLYVDPKKAPRSFAKKGKNGQEKFKSGKDHKTGYFASYKDFRQEVGRPTDKVDLDLTSDLRFDISNSTSSRVNPVQVSTHEYVVGFKRPHNVKKAEGHEKKYGTVYRNTDGEVKNFFDVSIKEFKLAVSVR